MVKEEDISRLAENLLITVTTAKDSERRFMALRVPYTAAYRLAAEAFGEPDRVPPDRTRPSTGNADIDALLSRSDL